MLEAAHCSVVSKSRGCSFSSRAMKQNSTVCCLSYMAIPSFSFSRSLLRARNSHRTCYISSKLPEPLEGKSYMSYNDVTVTSCCSIFAVRVSAQAVNVTTICELVTSMPLSDQTPSYLGSKQRTLPTSKTGKKEEKVTNTSHALGLQPH